MTREELMINDIVFDYTKTPVKVCAVGQDIVVKSSFRIGSLEPNELSPIPLTEEILVKNSDFTVRGEYVISGKHHNPYLRIAWSRDKEKFYFSTLGSNCYLDYVHQLQHLLRLVGVQKEIEL